MRVLHVDADLGFASRLRERLAADGVVTDGAATVSEARHLLATREYAAVVLELRLPEGDGMELVRHLRSARRAVPVLVVSGLGSEETVIRVLEAGADDYVLKPVSLELLRARFRALMRRGGARDGEVLRVGALVIDRGRREAWVGDTPLTLSALEFNLLAYLASRPDQVQSRDVLLATVWCHQGGNGANAGNGDGGGEGGAASNVVDVTIGRVRRRLAAAPGAPTVDSVRGVGYVLRSAARVGEWATRGCLTMTGA
jgi:DNA-binding response OmpR family regulator